MSRAAMRRLVLASAIAGLAGCVSFGAGDPNPVVWYELELPAKAPKPAPRGLRLQVDVGSGSSFYDALAIAYSRAPGQRAYYRYANWTEPVAPRLARLLRASLAADGMFADVQRLADGAPADRLLRVVVVDFYHDASSAPGQVRLRLDAEWIDSASRAVIAQRRFVQAEPVASDDAPAAVRAFDAALARTFVELDDWVGTLAR